MQCSSRENSAGERKMVLSRRSSNDPSAVTLVSSGERQTLEPILESLEAL
jgi:hypothetical protein